MQGALFSLGRTTPQCCWARMGLSSFPGLKVRASQWLSANLGTRSQTGVSGSIPSVGHAGGSRSITLSHQ